MAIEGSSRTENDDQEFLFSRLRPVFQASLAELQRRSCIIPTTFFRKEVYHVDCEWNSAEFPGSRLPPTSKASRLMAEPGVESCEYLFGARFCCSWRVRFTCFSAEFSCPFGFGAQNKGLSKDCGLQPFRSKSILSLIFVPFVTGVS
jgi:hypothetical protein